MTDEPDNQTLAVLRQIRADIAGLRDEVRDGFAKVDRRFEKLEAHITASDDENAKVLAQILQQTTDTQARTLNHAARINALEDAKPQA